jgi:predicted unusual protein kinase regulating ubiquinone biosynthesis (AarF/ABC1/UbiB family)
MLRCAHHPQCFPYNPLETIFERFDAQPLASASLAQGHRARFRGLQHREPQVRASKVPWGFDRSNLLVIENFQGDPVRTARALLIEERKALASLILRNFLKQIFVDNFFHADPHPGNILLLRDGVIGYLDFGTMGRLEGGAAHLSMADVSQQRRRRAWHRDCSRQG